MDWQNVATYVYDETNRMVDGKNEQGEHSLYTYNGLGIRVGRELIMQDNTHGYTDFHSLTPSVDTGIDKPEVVQESYVIDYTSPTFNTLVMEEEGGFDYRWVYGLDKLSVKITSEGTNWWGQNVKQDILKDYLHQDRLGSTTNLTDQFGRVVGRADYNEWGEVTYREALSITSSYRRIWPQLSYTGHDYDDVLNLYFAKARFYSADDKRFVAVDPIKGSIAEPLSLVPYVYCVDNPLRWVDPLGLISGRASMVNTMVSDGGGRNFTPEPKIVLINHDVFPINPYPNMTHKTFFYDESDAVVLYNSDAFSWTSFRSQAFAISQGLLEAAPSIGRVVFFDTAYWRTEDIQNWWDSLPDEIGYVVIDSHSGPYALELNSHDGERTGITVDRLDNTHWNGERLEFKKKSIGHFILFGCNNAHQDHPNNIAYKLASEYLNPGSKVIGTDGTLGNFIIDDGAYIHSEKPFKAYIPEGEDKNRTPLGFIQYEVNEDGTVSKTILGHYREKAGFQSMTSLKHLTRWLAGGEKFE